MANPLFWLDLEMTGLDEKVDAILEVAAVVTDLDLRPLEEFQAVVWQPQSVLESMNEWCREHHGKSGLTAAVPEGRRLELVETDLIALARRHFPGIAEGADGLEIRDLKQRIVLTGNSIGNDRRFVDRYWPRFARLLHYRMIDVSSFKEIFRDKYGVRFEKANAHRALGDIHESIRELGTYLARVRPDGE